MNKGIKLASGEIILILNSDDMFYKEDTLNKIVEVFVSNKNIDLVYGNLNNKKK